MLTLGIETSGRAGSIALVHDQNVLGGVELSATGRRHARTLVPEMGSLLRQFDLTPKDLELVAVSIGPGSFTGLRVGVVCAKTLAYAVGCHIIGIDTFQAIAAQAPAEIESLWVIEDALRGDVSAGNYVRTPAGWHCETEPHLIAMEEWLPTVQGQYVSGPAATKFIAELHGMHILDQSLHAPQARTVALLGESQYCDGQPDTAWNLQPHYMRRSAAEEKADTAGQ